MSGRLSRRGFLRGCLGAGAAAALAGWTAGCGGDSTPKRAQSASIALSQVPPAVGATYRYVAANRALAAHVPCYCGCGQFEGHQSLWDCFMKENGEFDEHASGCMICLDIARDVETLSKQGLDVKATRAAIDAKYRQYGPPTRTQ